MNKEEYTIKLDMIAKFEDKQIRVEDLLDQLFKENKQLKEIIDKIYDELTYNDDYVYDGENENHVFLAVDGQKIYDLIEGVINE